MWVVNLVMVVMGVVKWVGIDLGFGVCVDVDEEAGEVH